MKKHIMILFLLITSLFSSNIKVKNILLLHTYDYQYPWTKSLFDGMNTLQKESITPIKFYTEQIDFNKIKLKDKDEWVKYFSNKYKTIPIDGVVVVFGNAIKFISEYGNIIFKDIPKVVYGDTDIKQKKNTIFLRIENSLAVQKTVQVALSQNKNVKNIYILGNKGELTAHLTNLTKKYIKEYSSLTPQFISNLTADEVKIKLRTLPKDSIVFYTLFFKDKNGIKLSPKIYLEKFSKISNAPIYSYYSVLLRSGTVGGYVIDSKLLMQNMVKVLIDEKKEIKNKTYSIQAMFDYNALKKFNINTQEVPVDAIVINKPINYLKIYKVDILVLSLCFILTLFIITILNNKKRKKKLLEELETKNKLLHVKEEFKRFFELSINLQIIVNINDGKVVQINGASKSILGYEVKELVNTTFLKLVHPDDLQVTIDILEKLSNGEIVYFFENRCKHENGTYLNLAWSATTDPQNKLVYATAQNITKIKIIEKEKKKNEQLLYQQSKLAAMGEMIGMIAHQWRQPLSSISMDTNNMLLDIELEVFNTIEARNYAKNIIEQTQHLSKTIDDFRNFFKPDKVILEVNIKEIIDQTLSMVKDGLKNNCIELTTIYETNKTVKAYPRELMQVFVNIITNSKDVLVSSKKENAQIDIRVYEDKKYINTEICDNGGGIDIDILPQIFDPYFSTKDDKTGTGIGLYMSKMIIENHLDGSIEAFNKKDGACFIVRLLKEEHL